MKTQTFTICRPDTGAVLPLAVVTVYNADGATKATIFNPDGSALGNPITAGATGAITFAAADGTYILSPVSADGTLTVPNIVVDLYDLPAIQAAAAASATDAAAAATSAATSASNALQVAVAAQGTVHTLTTSVSAGGSLPFEVSALSGSFVGTGSGGTPGEYALVVSGGPAGHTAFITIGSDGKIASARIGARGIATANTAPTYSLPSGTGLTGATLPTATVTAIAAGRIFLAPNANSGATFLLGWTASTGVIAAWNVGGVQWSEYFRGAVDAVFAANTAPNILYDSFNRNTFDVPTLGGWNWYSQSGAITWTQASANIPIKTPVARVATNVQFRKRWDWARLGRRAGEAMRVSFLVHSAGLGGTLSVQFRDASGTAVGSAFTGSFAGGLSVVTIPISAVPSGAIAMMDVAASSTSAAVEIGGVFASVGTVPPAISHGPQDPQYALAYNVAKGVAPNLPAINKSLVESWSAVSGLTVTDGAFVNSTLWALIGQTSNGNYRWTVYTLTGNEPAIRVTSAMSGTSTWQIVYVNVNGEIIGREAQGTASLASTTTIATPPPGAVAMYVTGRTSGPIVVEVGALGSTLGPRVGANETAVSALKTWNDIALTNVDNKVVSRFNASISDATGFRYALVDLAALGITPDPAKDQLRVTSYVSGSTMALAVYVDASGTFISSQFPGTTTATYTNQVLAIPANAAKVYLGGRTTVPISAQVYGVGSLAASAKMPVYGKRIGFLGNSFTDFGYYQPEVLRLTGCEQSFSNGQPGKDFGYLADTTMPGVDLSATDILMITEGANEWGTAARSLGTIADSSSVNSTYGKMRKLLEQAYAKNPNVLVCFTGKTYSGKVWINGTPGYAKDPDTVANPQGLTGQQIDDAIRAFCAANALPFIDWRGRSGINAYTDGNASASSGTPAVEVVWTMDGLHPTPSTASNGGGGPRLGRIAAAEVNRSF